MRDADQFSTSIKIKLLESVENVSSVSSIARSNYLMSLLEAKIATIKESITSYVMKKMSSHCENFVVIRVFWLCPQIILNLAGIRNL